MTSAVVTRAESIAWGDALTISADTDVFAEGMRKCAYTWSNQSKTVNGVSFIGLSSAAGAGADVVFSTPIVCNTTAYASSGNPWNTLSANYQDILRGASYGTSFAVTLGNLIVGKEYAVQLWYHDARGGAGGGKTETVTSVGGNTVILDKNSTEANGGVGQYVLGTFTADAVTQVFAVASATASAAQINALQVRDITSAMPIAWGVATTISGDTDVSTVGTLEYAYAWANLDRTVNGVPFIGTSSGGAGAGTDLVFSPELKTNIFEYGNASGHPWESLSTTYREILKGASYGTSFTVTLGNLTVGKDYAVQLWYHDTRGTVAGGTTETVTTLGGNTVILDKNSTEANGGVGQYVIGIFTADGVTKQFAVSSATAYAAQINALQLREINPSPITWGTATTISGDMDVATCGMLEYAYAWSKTNQTVNGVSFSGSSSNGSGAGTDVRFSPVLNNNTFEYGNASGSPWDTLSANYQEILRGSSYGTSFTVTLGNLTIGREYTIQLWYHDARGGTAGGHRTETVTSTGGNTVILDKNSTEANGGVGQYVIGTFTATDTTQQFAVSSAVTSAAQINALQLRFKYCGTIILVK